MKIPFATLELAIAEYIEKDIIPTIPPMTIYPFGQFMPIELNQTLLQFACGTALAFAGAKLEQFAPTLQMLGLMDSEGMVDAEKAKTVLTEQLEKVGGIVPIGPFTFGVDAVEKIISYASQGKISI